MALAELEGVGMAKLQDLLGRTLAVPGVRAVTLVGREGLLIATAGRGTERLFEALGALGAGALNGADALGQEIGQGLVVGAIMEYERGLVSVTPYSEYAAMVALVESAASLGGLRQILRSIEHDVLLTMDQS
jgi:predicted regulator of Ras-like GTPase activity (Roadblock/LC7/MglB family)